jgi:hypothetical protein
MTMDYQKWFLKSKTVWGVIIVILSQLGPFLRAFGYDIDPIAIKDLGEQGDLLLGNLMAIVGGLLALYGRMTAETHLTVSPNTKV